MTVREQMVMQVESQRWKYAGAKEQHIREHLGYSAVRYFQVLNRLLDRPDVLAEWPQLVGRLKRLREARRRVRTAGVTVGRPVDVSTPTSIWGTTESRQYP